MLAGKYKPHLLTNLPVENSVGLFDYLASYYSNPYSNQIINLRPISYMNSNFRQNLVNIYDKKDFSKYWNCQDDFRELKYLDVDLNYHFFVPTHVHYLHNPARYPQKIEVMCRMSSEDMETILKIDNNAKHENTVKVEKEKMCRFFRYQMNGQNNANENNIDLYDFDLYGSLYASLGLINCTIRSKHRS